MTEPRAQRAVVVGGSLAGLRAAEGLRKGGFTGEIVVIDDEPHRPYNRPPLSKGVHQKSGLDPASLALRIPKVLHDVTWRMGCGVVQADLDQRELRFSDGTMLAYDGLVCATGLAARRLDAVPARDPDAPAVRRHVIRTIEDARDLFEATEVHRSLVIVGAGFLGCEVASVVTGMGFEVTVVAPEQVPMARPLGVTVGGAMLERHRAQGTDFRLGRSVLRVTESNGSSHFALDDGSELVAPVVLEAIGGVPAVGWLDGNGLDLTNGILADEYLRVGGFDTIVACGDVVRWPNTLFDGTPRRVEHWTTASESGRAAGTNLAAALGGGGEPETFTPLPSFWSDQVGLRIQSFGSPGLSTEDARILEGSTDGEFVAGYYLGNQLVGVVLVGLPTRMQHYRELVAAELASS